MKVKRLSVLAGLLVLAIVGVVVYYASNNVSKNNTYTVMGTLTYAHTGAPYVGVTVKNVTPSLSPSPVGSFMFLIFDSQTSRATFPAGFVAGNEVRLSGKISFDAQSQTYVMNVTSFSQTVPQDS